MALDALVDNARSITYGVVKPGESPPDGIRLVRGGDISNGRINVAALRTITPELSNQYNRTILRGGELIVSLVGNPGEVAIVPPSLAGANLARQAGLVPLVTAVNARYVMFFFMSHWGRAALGAETTGSVQRVINLADLKRVMVPLPSRPVQDRIASILSAYDDLIENNARRIAILEDMARRNYEEWFVRFRFPGHENVRIVESELGAVPEGWNISTLGAIADVRWGDTAVTKKSYVDEGETAYSAAGPDGKLPYADFDRTGIVLSAIGSCGVTWFASGKWSCIKNTIRFWSKDQGLCSDEFLFLATRLKSFWPVRGAAQPFVSLGDAREKVLLLPKHEQMSAFQSIVRPQFELCANLRRANVNLRATRDFLLPKLISGELDVSDFPQPEAAAA